MNDNDVKCALCGKEKGTVETPRATGCMYICTACDASRLLNEFEDTGRVHRRTFVYLEKGFYKAKRLESELSLAQQQVYAAIGRLEKTLFGERIDWSRLAALNGRGLSNSLMHLMVYRDSDGKASLSLHSRQVPVELLLCVTYEPQSFTILQVKLSKVDATAEQAVTLLGQFTTFVEKVTAELVALRQQTP
ncbi:hypothetical protein KBC79_04650 [Candidatus Woesebacteria bacterium]|nr:hypothetical protein [Candidatus Woesebacteria bacterium]